MTRHEDLLHAFESMERAIFYLKEATVNEKAGRPTTDAIVLNDRKAGLAKAFIAEYELMCRRYGLMLDEAPDRETLMITSTTETILKNQIDELYKTLDIDRIQLKFKGHAGGN